MLMVVAMVECRSVLETIAIGTLEVIMMVAAVCRRSWVRREALWFEWR